MKKFLAIVMCLTMALSMMTVVSFAANPAFTVASVEADPGEIVEVAVDVSNNPGITACAVSISYDPALVLTAKATNNNLFSGGSVVVGGNASANPYKVNWSDDFDNFYENGTFFTLKFQVPADAVPGTVYPINISYKQVDVYDADMNDVVFDCVNGAITVAGEVIEEEPETPVATVVPGLPRKEAIVILEPVGDVVPSEMGLVYTGDATTIDGASLNGWEFPSLAPAGVKAMVKVEGLNVANLAPYAK